MDQEVAQELFHNGATLVFLNVPPGTEFGIDYNSWTVGPRFKGVKMIPPGIHFCYYSAVNKENQASPRTGFFHNFQSKEVLVKKWDSVMEDIQVDPINLEEQERIEASKMDLDRYLGAYPYESYKKWISLSNHMTFRTVEKLQPENGKIYSVTQLQSQASTTQSRKAEAEALKNNGEAASCTDQDGLPYMETIKDSALNLTKIPNKKYPEGASPQQITKYSMDHSYVLGTLLQTAYDNNFEGILGELQFSFLCFMLGHVYDAFEQWKLLVHLLCSCDEALKEHNKLFSQFISMMHYHLREVPDDFFVDIVSQNNFLTSTLSSFFCNMKESDADASLKEKADRFRIHLEKKFQWDFSSNIDDEPVVVDSL